MEFITDFTLIHFRLNFKTVTDTFKALKRILGERRGGKRKGRVISSFFDQQSKRPSTEFKVTDALNRSELQRHDAFGSCCCCNVYFSSPPPDLHLLYSLCFTLECSNPCPLPSWPVNYVGLCTAKKMHVMFLNYIS